jgi:hypothetical protein
MSNRPPVEMLSDIAWARVERELWTALDKEQADAPGAPAPVRAGVTPRASSRRAWLGYAIGGVVVAAAAAVLFAVWPSTNGRVHSDLPSRVATAAAPTTVSFGDAEITVAPESTLMLTGAPARGVAIVLERGSARFAVSPRQGRPPFVVHAGAVDVRVVGTEFTVARSGDAARVDVTHGEVEVVAHGRRAYVRAGETWDSSRDREAATRSSAAISNPGDVAAARTLSDEPVAPSKAAPEPEPVDPRAAYEAAAALEPTDPDAALAAYRQLARGRGPWSANALYAAARLAENTDPALALSLAKQYQRRFPRGANVEDAAAMTSRLDASP